MSQKRLRQKNPLLKPHIERLLGQIRDDLNTGSDPTLINTLNEYRKAIREKPFPYERARRLNLALRKLLSDFSAVVQVEVLDPILSWKPSNPFVGWLIFLEEEHALERLIVCRHCQKWMVSRSVKESDKAQTEHPQCREAFRTKLMPLYMKHRYRAEKANKVFDGTSFFERGHCSKKNCNLCEEEYAKKR